MATKMKKYTKAELTKIGKRRTRTALEAEARNKLEKELSIPARVPRKKNVSKERLAQIDADMAAHVAKTDSEVLYASSAYGRRPSAKDWQAGKDFMAINPPVWDGGPYFSIRDAERIYEWGYRKIIIGGVEGFDIELVMQ